MATSPPTYVRRPPTQTHEMCNQYFMATESMRLSCSSRSLTPTRSFASAFSFATAGMPAGGMGQMTGLAHDEKAGRIYAIHRAQNNFLSTTRISTAAIVAFSYTGAIQAYLCKDTFVVPHGLSLDHHGGARSPRPRLALPVQRFDLT